MVKGLYLLRYNRIINGDCLSVMKGFPDESFDLIITSPPYNLRNSIHKMGVDKTRKIGNFASTGYDEHSDDMPYKDYIKWQRKCLKEMIRLIPDTGAIFYNHKWRVQGGLIQDRHEIIKGFPVRQIIIWSRHGGLNFCDSFFLPTYEVVYLIAKPKFKLKKGMNRFGDVWKITQETNKNPHPAPFPVELPNRILISVDNVSTVLDPFIGSGTTAIAAIQNGVKYIGIEKSSKYIEMAENRIKEFNDTIGKYQLFSNKEMKKKGKK